MPNHRFTFVPHPITGTTAETCRKYLEGNDPISGKPVLKEIIDAITVPLSSEDKKEGSIERPTPRMVKHDTEENLHRLFLENGWTDGLPIVLPTKERVAAMLEGTSHDANEIVGRMQPSSPHELWSYTVEKVAVNAVMAGAKPEHFPVILALASTGVTSLSTSTTSFATMVVVNGPVRKEINMNSGIGAMGPFSQANAVIGRAWTLLSINLSASGKAGETYMGSQGNSLNYNNLCFAENEEELPQGWKPFHVQKDFKPEESAVSVFLGWGITHPDQSFEKAFHPQIPFWLKFVSPFSSVTLFLDPNITNKLKDDEGFKSKEQLIDWIYKNTKVKVGDWKDDYYAVQNFVLPMGEMGQEPIASWMKLPDDAEIPQFSSPSKISILSVGGGTNMFWQAGDFSYLSSASVDEWR
ncbi:MAG: hypothetical protein PVG39_15065 [Desulfobacteraceae bacterium]|jgi:hypothetical protein